MYPRHVMLLVGVALGLLVGSYFFFTMSSINRSSSDCVAQGGYCIPAEEGCFDAGLLPYSEGICYEDNGRSEDYTHVCCVGY